MVYSVLVVVAYGLLVSAVYGRILDEVPTQC